MILNKQIIKKITLPEPVGAVRQGTMVADEFKRASLNPTGAIEYYTTAAVGSSTASINIGPTRASLLLSTGASTGDNIDVRLANLLLERQKDTTYEYRKVLVFKCLFSLTHALSHEGFIGLMLGANSALTGIPTTAAHVGLYWDRSAESNFMFSSGNGSAQSTTDSNVAVAAATDFEVVINWNGTDSATVTTTAGGSATHTASDLDGEDVGVLHIFNETETTSARQLQIVQWNVRAFGY